MTKTAYRADGAVHETTDANGRKTRLLYDDAGRVAARIANATGASPPLGTAARDTDVYTRYVYGDGLLKKIWGRPGRGRGRSATSATAGRGGWSISIRVQS